MKYIKIYYLWREDIAWQLFEVADQEAAASEGMIAPGRKQSEIDFGDDGAGGAGAGGKKSELTLGVFQCIVQFTVSLDHPVELFTSQN